MAGPSGPGCATAALGAAVVGGSLAVGGALSSVGAAAYFARKALTPDRQRPDDTQILAVDERVGDPRPHRRDRRAGPVRAVAGRLHRVTSGSARSWTSTRSGAACVVRSSASTSGTWRPASHGGTSTTSPDRRTGRCGCRPSMSTCTTELGTMPAWVDPGRGARPAAGRSSCTVAAPVETRACAP